MATMEPNQNEAEDARDALIFALQKWIIGDPPMLSWNVRDAIRHLNRATNGGVARLAQATRIEIL